MSDINFPPRIDTLILLLLLAGSALGVAALLDGLLSAGPVSWLSLLTAILGIVLPLWLLLGTGYRLHGRALQVRCGPLWKQVDIADITAIAPSRSLWAAPALSRRRLRIELEDGGWLLIAPQDPEHFIAEVQARRAALRPAV